MLKVTLSTSVSSHPRRAANFAARAKPKKKVTVGSANATLSVGATRNVSISLNGSGRKLLAKSHKLKVTLSVLQQKVGSFATVLSQGLTFKAKAKKKHHG